VREVDFKKRHLIYKIIFGIFGIIIIPSYAILFSQNGPGGDLILVTFSQIGSRYGGIEGLIIWGIMSSLYYFLFLSYLFNLSGVDNIFLKAMLIITCLSLLITVFLPFAPSMYPVASLTHNRLAYITAIATIVTLFSYVFSLMNVNNQLFLKSIISLSISVTIILVVYLTYGVSSLFQIVLSTILCSFLLCKLLVLLASKWYNNKR